MRRYCAIGLVELDLGHNELTAWPEGLGSGGVLERILLHHNQIRVSASLEGRRAGIARPARGCVMRTAEIVRLEGWRVCCCRRSRVARAK